MHKVFLLIMDFFFLKIVQIKYFQRLSGRSDQLRRDEVVFSAEEKTFGLNDVLSNLS